MYCSNCGKELDKNAKFCNECGKKVTANKKEEVKEEVKNENEVNETKEVITNIPESNSKGVASLVLGIASLFLGLIFIPVPIVGLILGILQKKKNGIAIAGIIINAFSLVSIVLIWLIFIVSYSTYKTRLNNDDIDDSYIYHPDMYDYENEYNDIGNDFKKYYEY